VKLDWDDGDLVLMIADNGDGFRLEDSQADGHYGLKFMQERIKSLKGDFSIHAKKREGTRIKIVLPYK
jgi:signal transduction histidine kinase